MSANEFFNVWKNSQMSGSQLLIMMAISNYADEYGVAWPQLDTISKQSRVDRRTITRQIPSMIGKELIYFQESASIYSKAHHNARSNLYIVLLNRPDDYIEKMQKLWGELKDHTPIYGGILSDKNRVDKLSTLLELITAFGQDIFDDKVDKNADRVDKIASRVDSLSPDLIKELNKELNKEIGESEVDFKLQLFLENQFNKSIDIHRAYNHLELKESVNGTAVFICHSGEKDAVYYQNIFNTLAGINHFNGIYGASVEKILVEAS